MTKTLQAQSITKRFHTRSQELLVLDNVSLDLDRGESAAIMGPSGSGKSTLLNILGTLEPPDSGSFLIDGDDPFQLRADALARFRNRRIGFIFQEHHLLPQCSVIENVLVPTLVATGTERDASGLGRAKDLLQRMGLGDRLDHRPSELSGGERQRVAIARALINRPSVLLADEPTGNLDRTTADAMGALLDEVHQAENTVLIVVTHSESLAKTFQNRFELRDHALARV